MIELMVSSSVLIIAIITARGLFRGKVGHGMIYALWLLVVIRLVMPLPIYLLNQWNISMVYIESPLSIMNVADNWISKEHSDVQKNPDLAVHNPNTTVQAEKSDKKPPQTSINFDNDSIPSTVSKKQISLHLFLWIAWMVGCIFILILQSINAFKLQKELILNREENEFLGQKVYVIKNLPTPLLARGKGWKSDIYIPDSITDDPQLLCHAIAHENIHKKHGDIWWGYVRNFLLAVYWFHPFVWIAAYLSKRDSEYACDSSVMKQMTYEEKMTYGESLLKMIELNGNSSVFCTATTMSAGKSEMKRRITMLKHGVRKSFLATIAILVLVVALSNICFTKANSVTNDTDITVEKANNTRKTVTNDNTNFKKQETKPTKKEILQKKAEVFDNVDETTQKMVIDKIKYYNLAMEHDYLWDNIFEKLKDEKNLHWNLLYEKGDVQIGWAYESGKEYNPKKTKLSEAAYNQKYGQKVTCENKVTADDFIKEMNDLKKLFKGKKIQEDFETIIADMEQAQKTRNVEYLIHLYQILHDMDYYLFRDKDEVQEYMEDTSLVDKYYGVLEVYK